MDAKEGFTPIPQNDPVSAMILGAVRWMIKTENRGMAVTVAADKSDGLTDVDRKYYQVTITEVQL